MFDQLLRELRKLEDGILVPVEMPVDDDGYFDRQCPAEQCKAVFKVLFSDWKEKVRDEQVFCPICRWESPATEWNTEDQAEHMQAVALAHLQRTINQSGRTDTERFNRSQPRGGFISLSLSYRPGALPVLVSPAAAEAMRQIHACEECSCKYASIGAAFFCPCCGANSTEKMFEAGVEAALKTVQSLPALRVSLLTIGGSDAAHDTCRLILENTQASLVGIFQHYVGALYGALGGVPKARKNVFQNLRESSRLWKDAIGCSYEDLVRETELVELNRLFQQRHLIAHRGGIVDADYIVKSGDTSYSVGQRIVVSDQSVVRLSELVLELGRKLRRGIPT